LPDWSYQTVFRPLLFRLPATTARDLTLNLMGTLARVPGGSAVIDFLGHMRPPDALARTALGIAFPTPVGLGAGLDVNVLALPALARFGFGFLEIGPVTVEPITSMLPVQRHVQRQTIWYPEPLANPGLEVVVARLARVGPLPIPVGIRLGHAPGASASEATREQQRLVAALGPHAAFFTLDALPLVGKELWPEDEWREHLRLLLQAVGAKPLLLALPPDTNPENIDSLLGPALGSGMGGVVIGGSIAATPQGRETGPPARDVGLAMVRRLRQRHGKDLVILASGGVLEPQDALDYFEAGATLVQIHSGLVYAGPGFPKRINDALEATAPPPPAAAPPPLAAVAP
jgi:dihydroorotate dehydrogenase